MMKAYWTTIIVLIAFLAGCNNDKSPVTSGGKAKSPDSTVKKKTIVFFGNSLTAGYGLSPSEAFPALIQAKIDSAGLPYKVVNAGVSGETSSGGNGRIDWILKQPLDVFVLELGANDGLRGIPLSETRKSLQAIIDKVKAKNPDVKMVLAGMQIPPNMGAATSEIIIELIFNLNKEAGTTLILVTHDLDLANKTGRILKLKGGRIVSDEMTATRAYAI